MRRFSLGPDLIPFEPEPERTFHRRRNLLRTRAVTSAENTSAVIMPKLDDYSQPKTEAIPNGFKLPQQTPANFEFKPAFLNLLERNQFGGGATEDPHRHIQTFVDYCSTIKQTGVEQDEIRMLLFPFSLRDDARDWITDLDRAAYGVDDWQKMALVFYQQYYPVEKTNRLRSQMTGFRQNNNENLFDAWKRYKKLLRECPHHGLNNWLVILQFYNGLLESDRMLLDSTANGNFAGNTDEDKAWALIEKTAMRSQQYSRHGGNSSNVQGTDSINVLTSHIAALTQQLGKFQGPNQSLNAVGSQADAFCGACGGVGHTSLDCRVNCDQVNAFQAYNPGYQNPNLYNANMRNHPNFSWKSTNVLNPPAQQQIPYQKPYQPPGFQGQTFQQPQQFQQAPAQNQSNVEVMLKQMMDKMSSMDQRQKTIETQLAQMATSSSTRQQGLLPAKSNQPHETLNAVTLRSGAQYDGPERPKDDLVEGIDEDTEGGIFGDDIVDVEDASDDEAQQKTDRPRTWTDRPNEDVEGRNLKADRPRDGPIGQDAAPKKNFQNFQPKAMGAKKDAEIKLPFPSRQQDKKTDAQFGKFLEVVKDLQVSIPFTDLLLQVPSYAKFMKDILTRKRALSGNETVALAEECNFMTQGQSPPKLRDPGSFSIPCTIGPLEISNALCDLGASVSVMPYSMYLKLNAGSLTFTSATVQLADRSYRRPRGILEDMPVKIGKFWIPVDFLVMDIAEDDRTPILLGRPFLNTAGAVIDVKRGRMTLEVGDETIVFNLSKTPTKPMVEETLGSADILNDADWYMSLLRDPFDTLLSVECAAIVECRSKEKQPAEKDPGWGRKDPRRRTDPRWERVYNMHDADFEECGEYPVEFVNAIYENTHKLLYDPAGKGADGVS